PFHGLSGVGDGSGFGVQGADVGGDVRGFILERAGQSFQRIGDGLGGEVVQFGQGVQGGQVVVGDLVQAQGARVGGCVHGGAPWGAGRPAPVVVRRRARRESRRRA
ncbi:hypothetical protein RZS08_59920, partial [Arthrospira platensis SPKY1]|nr:hypothetical protein [Arthrospira platensis SPKY1]